MRYAHPLSLLLAVLISGCTTDEDRIQARLETLPELPAAIAEQLDSTTMALRAPDLGTLPEPELIADPKRAPCCGMKITKRLKVLYETTWCINPIKDLVLDARPARNAQGDAGSNTDAGKTTVVRHSKLTSLHGKRLLRPFWCQTSSGPWDAELVYDHGCFSGPIYTLLVSTPGGLVGFPPWVGGEENKPPSVTVMECTLVSTQRTRCNGLSSCDCHSSTCSPPAQCGCTVF